MKLLKQTLIAAAVGASISAGTVHAAAIGTSYLLVEDLVATNDAGEVLTIGVDIAPFGNNPLSNVGDTTARLDGVTQTETLNSPPAPISDVSGAGFSCVGACAYVNNSFTYLTKPADVASSYVVSDIVAEGALAAGVPDGSGGFIPVGATAQTLAESAVVPDSVGSADSNVGNISTFEFIALEDGDITFSGNYTAYLRAAIIGGLTGVNAFADLSWSISLFDREDQLVRYVFNLSSDDEFLTNELSATVPEDDFEASFGGSFTAGTTGGFLKAGRAYQLTVAHTSTADSRAALVAIPAPLALMGAGLLVLGGIQRKRNKAAAA